MIVGHWGGWYPGDPHLVSCAPIPSAAAARGSGSSSVDAARRHCDALGAATCGGFIRTAASVVYCAPGSFVSGAANSSSAGYRRVGFSANPILTACDPLPSAASDSSARDPPTTVKEAEAQCAALTPAGSCGGFLFRSPAVRSALAAAGVGAAPPVTYCKPGTFQSGTPNATSAVGYPRGGLDASGLIGGMGGGNQ